ncbi:MAG TPA: CBS domain-containing protein [Actinomycetota bacterium]|nr:CBS domain-containing protein [Actinomycetota bacterium]
MTPDPAVISLEAELSEAGAMMLKLKARHLSVCEEGRVIGMLAARDILVDEAWPGGSTYRRGSARVRDTRRGSA